VFTACGIMHRRCCLLVGWSGTPSTLPAGSTVFLCLMMAVRAETCYLIGDSKEEASLDGFHFSLCIFVPDDGRTYRNMLPDW